MCYKPRGTSPTIQQVQEIRMMSELSYAKKDVKVIQNMLNI